MNKTFTYKLLVALWFILVSFNSIAKDITLSDASRVAASFSYQWTKKSDSNLKQVVCDQISTENPLFYIFNVGDNEGFVIVSKDDVTRPIMGFSQTACFQYDQHSIDDLTKILNKKVETARLSSNANSTAVKEEWDKYLSQATSSLKSATIYPSALITSQWNQGFPYNYACPVNAQGDTALAGCVPITMAQVLRYWALKENRDITGHGSVASYQCEKMGVTIPALSLDGEHYDWYNMLDNYGFVSDSNLSDMFVQTYVQAVAKLILHCGISINANYNIESTTASINNCAIALKDHFEFDKSIQIKHRENYSADNWNAMIKDQLSQQIPIIYRGQHEGGSHCFICDGYNNETDLYHFVFGWGNDYNGYYPIELLEVFEANGQINGYNENQVIVVNAFPNRGGIENYELYVDNETFSYDTVAPNERVKFSFTLYNQGITDWNGTIICSVIDTNGVLLSTEILNCTNIKKNSVNANQNIYLTIPNGTAPGSYSIRLSYWYFDNGSLREIALPRFNGDNFEPVITVVNQSPHYNIVYKDCLTEYDYYLNGEVARIFVKLTNQSLTDFNDTIICTFKNNVDTVQYSISFESYIKSGKEKEFQLQFSVPQEAKEGRYEIQFSHDGSILTKKENSGTDSALVIKNETEKHIIQLVTQGESFHISSEIAHASESFTIEYCLKNIGIETFEGLVAAEIIDTETGELVSSTNTYITICSRRKATTTTYITLPDDIQPGLYKIQFVGKDFDDNFLFNIYASDNEIYWLNFAIDDAITMLTGVINSTTVALDSISFPDEIFREYLSNHFDTDKDNLLSEEEIANIAILYIPNLGIQNLQGIEYLKYLTYMDCSGNTLIDLDISQNTLLNTLRCESNQREIMWDGESISLNLISCNLCDISKIEEITGATINDGIILPSSDTITYIYNIGNGQKATFKLLLLSNDNSSQSTICKNLETSIYQEGDILYLWSNHEGESTLYRLDGTKIRTINYKVGNTKIGPLKPDMYIFDRKIYNFLRK